jgi:hypothetical protein
MVKLTMTGRWLLLKRAVRCIKREFPSIFPTTEMFNPLFYNVNG